MLADQTPAKSKWSATFPVWIGMLGVAALIGVLGIWGHFATISGAVIVSGMVQVESSRQVVQHPQGGVIASIEIKEGDLVEAGSVLARFDDKIVQSERAIVATQLQEIQARKARLIAERNEDSDISFGEELLHKSQNDAEVLEFLHGQTRLFEARRESLSKQVEQLSQRKDQIGIQIQGASSQLTALQNQLGFIDEELVSQRDLLAKGLAQASRVLSLQREEARLQGSVGELKASMARGKGQIIETDLQILQLQSQRREEAISTLRDLSFSEIELAERLITLEETLERMSIRAPMSGIVHGLTIHTIRSVVRPAEPILYIVPSDSPLIISSRIEAIHVDQVHVGQPASMRFSTFEQRTTPEIFGKVSKVSADVFQDQATGVSYYSAEIEPNEGEIERLGDVEILPGMPVETYIKTTDRSPLSYLVKPFADYFNRAFRE
ncbi:MAG: HlyD family type I secretion periplasmic adaptor subunit [Rhodobacteraceae bacterium]|nr:HlyD family type I secretion periplasmic adaptor subunit [Paracoccaceae bacterium]